MFGFHINAVKDKFTPQAFKDIVTSSLLDQLGSTPRWNYGWDGKGNTTTINVDTPIINTETLNKIAAIVNKQLHTPQRRMDGAPLKWGIEFMGLNGEVATFSVTYEVPDLKGLKGTAGGQSGKEQKSGPLEGGFLN